MVSRNRAGTRSSEKEDEMNVVTGFFQIVAVLSAIPFVFWLVNFIQSPSLIGGLLVALGVVIAYIGLGLCALTGGVKL